MNEKPDKHAENRLLDFEDCAEAIDKLFKAALSKQGNTAFDEFLDFARRMNNLSVYNAMLVRLQRPGAALALSRRQWGAIGRKVIPDAVPIVILHPFGPVRFVYEQGDTTGESMPAQDQSPLFAEGQVSREHYVRTIKAAEKFGVEIVETEHYGNNLAGTAAGFWVFPQKTSSKKKTAFRVKLNSKHDRTSRYSTLAHELGHIYCGHLGEDSKGRWPERRLSQKASELEAEAVAWLVCQRNGVTTRSKEYLSRLIDEEGLQSVSMYTIYTAANRIESRTLPDKK